MDPFSRVTCKSHLEPVWGTLRVHVFPSDLFRTLLWWGSVPGPVSLLRRAELPSGSCSESHPSRLSYCVLGVSFSPHDSPPPSFWDRAAEAQRRSVTCPRQHVTKRESRVWSQAQSSGFDEASLPAQARGSSGAALSPLTPRSVLSGHHPCRTGPGPFPEVSPFLGTGLWGWRSFLRMA